MQLIDGIVKNIKIISSVSGVNDMTTTTHSAAFELDGVTVIVKGDNVIHISDGDKIRVAGENQDDGVFQGLAFYNMTNKVLGETSNVAHTIAGYVLIIAGICTIPIIVGFLIIPLGVHFIKTSKNIDRANELAQTGF